MLNDEMVVLDVRLARSGADDELARSSTRTYRSSSMPAYRDEVRRLRKPEVHQRDEALPSCENPRVVAEIPQQRQGFGAVLQCGGTRSSQAS